MLTEGKEESKGLSAVTLIKVHHTPVPFFFPEYGQWSHVDKRTSFQIKHK